MKNLFLLILITFFFSCKDNVTKPINEATTNPPTAISTTEHVNLPYPDSLFSIFEMKEGEVTYVMKKYFIAFLKEGPKRDQLEEEATKIQNAHMAHLGKLADEKRICMVGPFGEDADSDIQGIIIFSVPDKEEAMRLAAEDPAVKAGRLIIEVQPWWAAKGSELF